MEDIKDDVIETVYNYSFGDRFQQEDLDNRRFCINYEIDSTIINDIVYFIFRYNRLDKGIPVKDRKPIILYINSPGGNLVDGYSVIDAIMCSETPIYTVNIGMCASMGFLIYLAGARRYAMPHSEFLMHDGAIIGYDSTAKMKDRIEFEAIQLENMNKDYILSRTKIDNALYEKKYRCEWYFLPEEGKRIGAVDYIVGRDCNLDEIL